MKRLSTVLLVPVLLSLLTGTPALGGDLKKLLDLRGNWKFEVGDDLRWAEPSFSDKDWVSVSVPATWETQGFPGYDGYGWYRRALTVPADWTKKRLFLQLGRIDDIDEVYLNGRFIGFNGSFPPNYETAYGNTRLYPIPPGVLIPGGKNVLAVRVYDSEMGGGIVQGPLTIAEDPSALIPDQSLEGKWKFKTGDDLGWALPGVDEKEWETAAVPSFWETQGHRGYDGVGWYRLKFRPSDNLKDKHLIMFLGKIDDLDEVYLNGQRIGKTGKFTGLNQAEGDDDLYRLWRAYTIPSGLLRLGAENVLAVRIFDKFMHGGIYEGPIGIVIREKYMQWDSKSTQSEKKKNPWRMLEWLFE
jgi:sialate O-acetylesterase